MRVDAQAVRAVLLRSSLQRRKSMKRTTSELERGRAAYAQRAWADAYAALVSADRHSPLAEDDLEKLALSAGLSGHDAEMLQAHERLYQLRLDGERAAPAARAAFWIGFRLSSMREIGKASAWLQRAQRLAERAEEGCVEQGYLLLPAIHRQLAAGEYGEASATASAAVALAERFADPDLLALGRNLQGRALVCMGELERGLCLLDEAMLPAANGELSPIVTGLVYCNVIASLQRVYALQRAREWTDALGRWCAQQPQLVPFAGTCLVHRSEILQLGGAWNEASDEARRCSQHASVSGQDAVGSAFYQLAEIQRLRGELDAAEASYRSASEHGREPQPGLALLRLAQGQGAAAQNTIRRVLGAVTDPLLRAQHLPAYVEIMLAGGELEHAREACGELELIAQRFDTEILLAIAAHARGAIQLADGDAQGAVPCLRRAFDVWQQVGAPYLAARLRVLIARACSALGDHDGAALELDAARAVFTQLGAARDLAALDTLSPRPVESPAGTATATSATRAPAHGLSARELEVLRLLATGKTNKAIAHALFLSEKTVDRHVSNIFDKLDVHTRAAATAYAYAHALL
jgi:DNA-binding CsgD family transcriptional regulator